MRTQIWRTRNAQINGQQHKKLNNKSGQTNLIHDDGVGNGHLFTITDTRTSFNYAKQKQQQQQKTQTNKAEQNTIKETFSLVDRGPVVC